MGGLGPTERSGSFKLQSVDDRWTEEVFGFLTGARPAPEPDGPYDIVIIPERQPVPCPSFWRHPIRWLRWNPLLLGPETRIYLFGVSFDGCVVGFQGGE